jgi:hypothetical protein
MIGLSSNIHFSMTTCILAFARMIEALALAACTSAEEFRAATEQACADYGYKPGTPDFAACLQQRTPGRRGMRRERGF